MMPATAEFDIKPSNSPTPLSSRTPTGSETGCHVTCRNASPRCFDATEIMGTSTQASRSGRRDLIRVTTKVKKPFPPMSNAMNPKEDKRFFQAHVIEFHNGGTLTWD